MSIYRAQCNNVDRQFNNIFSYISHNCNVHNGQKILKFGIFDDYFLKNQTIAYHLGYLMTRSG